MKYKLLIFIILLAFTSIAKAQEKLKSNGQMPILAWYSILPDAMTVERFQELKEAGINISFSHTWNIEDAQKSLDLAQKAGVKSMIMCPELRTETEKTVKRFKNHPALAGYWITDEPSMKDFKELGVIARKINSIDDNHFSYINLFPIVADSMQLGTKSYKEHVQTFIKEVPVRFLSFDFYPTYRPNELSKKFYENLELFLAESKKIGKDFWSCIWSTGVGNDPAPTMAEIRYQVFTNLAYGAQGIQYFTYWSSVTDVFRMGCSPIGVDGKRSMTYDKVRAMNQEINNLSGVFYGCKVLSVAQTGDSIPPCTKRLIKLPKAFKLIDTKGEGAVVSHLENGNNEFIVIVNRDYKNSMELTICAESYVKRVLKDGTLVSANAYTNTLDVEPGDIMVYMFEKNK